uniref:Cytochrome b n=1 Tax=Aphrocallistes vastus TaxID=83887 RepID=B2BRP8_APHVA|nr:cytochrome b [Aphrocallistes vastus]ABR58842.1 apocytochrome b [Aphrocallistes vastus]
MKPLRKSLRKDHFLLKVLSKVFSDLPTPSNINYYWNFGSLLRLCMLIQLLTGILLAMHYCPNINMAFDSIAHTTRNVSSGYILRNIHANRASIFFMCVYFHIRRNIYHRTWKNSITWLLGIIIYIIMIITSFIGYVLPWGQMSFWAATVITNLLSAIPYIGNTTVQWVWGGFRISNATLNRFYRLHYLLPFLLLFLIVLHIIALHTKPQRNPTGTQNNRDKIPFHHYYSIKDLQTVTGILLIITYLTTINPYISTDPENFLKANPLVTPTHIQPEWYFLFAYAILRSIPNKLGGVIVLIARILILCSTLLLKQHNLKTTNHRPNFKLTLWRLLFTFILLTWIGRMPAEDPFTTLRLIITAYYFIIFIIFLRKHSKMENNLINTKWKVFIKLIF